MNTTRLFDQWQQDGFTDWVAELRQRAGIWFTPAHHGDFSRWAKALDDLPAFDHVSMDYTASAISVNGDCVQTDALRDALQRLRPWRKGPYQFADVFVDTEWRSDFKWDRVAPHLASLQGRRVLDVGCGNGYHAWRMLAHNPQQVVGIDPSVLFNLQFQAVQHYARDERIQLLPLTIQELPEDMAWFDTVFSMGVLYHRRSPFDHLYQLKSLLKQGGELCLETLIIQGGRGQVLVPESRYARMNNVWFLPSADELVHWVERVGFKNVRVVDVTKTTIDEQRATEWMQFESLDQCLDPNNPDLTVEGYPAPLRAVVLANK